MKASVFLLLAGWLLWPGLAQAQAGQHITAVVPITPGVIQRYEKFEVGLALDRNFTADSLNQNPFDPEDVSVEAVFIGPSGRVGAVRYGFYYQDFSIHDSYLAANNARYWQASPTPQPWRVRFAPDEVGSWRYELKVTYRDGTTETLPARTFECGPSAAKGFLKVAPNKRNLIFDRGQPFFAIGSNVDYWSDNPIKLPPNVISASPKNIATCAGTTKIMTLPLREQRKYSTYTYEAYNQVFRQLRAVGGNFARVWMQEYNWDIEVYDSVTKVNTLGYYQPVQYRMYDLDRTLASARTNDVYLQLSLLDGIRLWNTATEKKWRTFPYAAGLHFGPKEQLRFFTDSIAKKLFKNKIRYVVSRWGYSPNLAAYELLNEGDFVNAGALFGQNNRQDVPPLFDWTLEMAGYLKSLDARHLQTLAYGPENSYRLISEHPDLVDYSVSHDYTASFNAEVRRSYLTQAMTQLHAKPYQLQEVDYAPYINTAYQVKFHTVFWATAFSGSFGIALPLSAFANLHQPCYPSYTEYRPLARFLAATKFASTATNSPVGNATGAAAALYGPNYAAALGQDIHRPLLTGLPDSLNVNYFSPCDRQCPPGWQQSVGITPFFTDPLDRGALNQNDKLEYLVKDIATTNDGLIEVYALRNEGKLTGWVHNKTHYWYTLPHIVQGGGFCEDNSCSTNPSVSKNLNNTKSNTITPLIGQKLLIQGVAEASGPLAQVSYRVQWFYTHLGVDADGDGNANNGGFIKSLEQPAVRPINGVLQLAIPPLVALGTRGLTSAPDYAFCITQNPLPPAASPAPATVK